MFPPKTAAIKQTKNGIVAKSPKGKVVLPGKITANKIVIGTKINEEDNMLGVLLTMRHPFRYIILFLGNVFEQMNLLILK